MRVALVHDWLTGMRGGEKCLEVFCEIFPDADLFTLLHVPGSVSKIIESRSIETSPIQHMPRAEKKYRYYLPLMPAAVRMLDLSGYDFILSSSRSASAATSYRGTRDTRGFRGRSPRLYSGAPLRPWFASLPSASSSRSRRRE